MGLERFDEIAEPFDRITETRLHWRLRCGATAPLRPVAGRTVLDLGTGPGGLALDLAQQGAQVVGLDGAPEMLQRARLRVQRAGHAASVALVQGDATRIPLSDDSVSDVAGLLVLHLLKDPAAALRECGRVLRPGGRLALVTQSDDFAADTAARMEQPLDQLEQEFLQGCHGSAESHLRRDRDAWRQVFESAGLPAPTITHVVPGLAWLLFARLPGGSEDDFTGESHERGEEEGPAGG
jgi:ubiquinone/menaquinone biosynthesis C-methylase UbiE